MNKVLIPAGRYVVTDVMGFAPEDVAVSYTVPAGVYYSTDDSGLEVYVGDFDDEDAVGSIGLVAADEDEDDVVVFENDVLCNFDEDGIQFGSVKFEF
jgi:hypothetical protein